MRLTERQDLIEWKEKELSIVQQAELLGANRSNLYYQAVPPAQEEVRFKHRIDEMYTETPVYGYRRIPAQLHHEGRKINPKTVALYMREMGLEAIYPGPNLIHRDVCKGKSHMFLPASPVKICVKGIRRHVGGILNSVKRSGPS